ncbi:MAG: phosphoglycerate mutase, partial [Clostridia bacterium]|nr:phosphoglycerate mutase [Clostridia bacterium]
KGEEYRIAVLPDHPTPICLRTHAPEPVPFAVFTSGSRKRSGFERYSEKEAAHSSLYIPIGSDFMARFISGDLDARRLL